jgi:hypothetical protein
MDFKKYISVALLLVSPVLKAHDHLNLEHGVPLEVEDAYVTPYMNREFHTYMTYDRLPENKDRLLLVPRLELGLFRNFQFELASPFEFGDRDKKVSRNIELDGLYNFNMETLYIPGISLGGGVYLPTGEGRHGHDTHVKLNLTKTLPIPVSFHRLHANIDWTQNAEPRSAERDNAFKYVLGYQVRLGTDDFVIADYFYEEQLEKNMETHMVEVGWRHQYNPLTVLATGAGAGLTDESPDFRFNVSFQRAINLFY